MRDRLFYCFYIDYGTYSRGELGGAGNRIPYYLSFTEQETLSCIPFSTLSYFGGT